MAYTRKFGGKQYRYYSTHFVKQSAQETAEQIRHYGGLARITMGSTFLTHSIYYTVWSVGVKANK